MKYIIRLIPLFVCLCFSVSLNAQKTEYTDTAIDTYHTDDRFIEASMDSLANYNIFRNNGTNYTQIKENKYNFTPSYVPVYPDSVYFYRIQQLDVKSPMELSYNPIVKDFINYYSIKSRGSMTRAMGLGELYFPLFEEMLDQYKLPLELKYLAVVESALKPTAKSWVGASGLWQFMYNTGKVYDLEVTSYMDDRCDPIKATRAACLHFKDLYQIFGDWMLVLAAYNSGAGNVKKAINRSGGKKNFWEIRPFLPKETQNYVPAFIAVTYVMSFSQEHNLYPNVPPIRHADLDTIAVVNPLSLRTISEKLNLNYDELSFLNPMFKTDYIPAYASNPIYIRLPKKSIENYLAKEAEMYADFKLKKFEESIAKAFDEPEYIQKKMYHKVRSGENMASIAKKYGCSSSDIKRWNKLRSTKVAKGRSLAVYTRVKNPDYVGNAGDAKKQDAKVEPTTSEPKEAVVVEIVKPKQEPKEEKTTVDPTKTIKKVPAKYYTVKKGDGLGKIADKYNVSVEELKKWNKLKKNTLVVNQKLRVNAPTVEVAVANTDKKKLTNAHVEEGLKVLYYTVQPKDTLWSISEKYKGVSVSQMVEWNNIEDYSIQPGQKLKVLVPAN